MNRGAHQSEAGKFVNDLSMDTLISDLDGDVLIMNIGFTGSAVEKLSAPIIQLQLQLQLLQCQRIPPLGKFNML